MYGYTAQIWSAHSHNKPLLSYDMLYIYILSVVELEEALLMYYLFGFPLCCFVKLVNQGISVELIDMVERLKKEHYKKYTEQRFK